MAKRRSEKTSFLSLATRPMGPTARLPNQGCVPMLSAMRAEGVQHRDEGLRHFSALLTVASVPLVPGPSASSSNSATNTPGASDVYTHCNGSKHGVNHVSGGFGCSAPWHGMHLGAQ